MDGSLLFFAGRKAAWDALNNTLAPTPYSRRNICSLLTLLTMAFAAA